MEISDGVDGSLPNSKKLPLVTTGNREQRAAYTAMVVYESQELGHKGHRDHKDFMTNCAYALASLGLLRASSLSAYSEEESMGPPTFHMNAKTQADRADTAITLSGERAFTRATAHMIRCHIDKPPSLSAFCYTDAHIVLKHTAYMITDTAEPEDGDWRVFNGTLPSKKPDGFDGTVEINKVQAALTMIIATKINWWLTNHHTGQGAMSGYALKVFNTVVAGMYENKDQSAWVDIVHTAGHWAFTKNCPDALGIRGINLSKGVPVWPHPSEYILNKSADMLLRVESTPAGTHKHATLEACLRMVMRHKPFLLCPGLASTMGAVSIWVKMKKTESLAKLHIGAYYLTGYKRAEFNDADAEQHLSAGGIYVKRRFPRGTLSGAACMDENKLVSYPKYDHSWDDFCKSLVRSRSDKKNNEKMRQ